jgi:CO/xanthine dehydrogenase FAD-binding subunit
LYTNEFSVVNEARARVELGAFMDGTRLSDGLSSFARPALLDEALALLSSGDWTILAGGTDYFPGWRDRARQGPVLDISNLQALRGICEDQTHWRIGALTTWSDIIKADMPPAFDALKLAAREVGSVQIQNRGTVAGNLCNASPAADGVPPLMILDPEIVLTSLAGERRVPLGDFILGNRSTALTADELVTEIRVPKSSSRGMSGFTKLGSRVYLVISIAMIAARLEITEDGTIADAAISVGACSVVARRLPGLENKLLGRAAHAETFDFIDTSDMADLSPIDDIRAPASYRLGAAVELTRRALIQCVPEGLEQ